MKQALEAIEGVSTVHPTAGDGFVSYRVEGENAELCPAIHDVVREKGWRIAELRPDMRTLESVFRSLTEKSAAGHERDSNRGGGDA